MNVLPSAATRLLVLLGDPVSHSLSPTFQNAAVRAAALDAVYVALRCSAGSLPELLRAIARAGGAGNVTVPHKQLAAATVERRTEAVERTGACNTFWFESGEIWGDNTDVTGIAHALHALPGGPSTGARVLLLGAGGAAHAALDALIGQGAREVVLLNRTAARTELLRDRFAGSSTTTLRAVNCKEDLSGDEFDLVINSTSLGLHADDPLPLSPGSGIRFRAALDLVYRPEETPWVRAVRSGGVPAADGMNMLLYQGAAAFERWWGRPAPIHAMQASLPRSFPDEEISLASHGR